MVALDTAHEERYAELQDQFAAYRLKEKERCGCEALLCSLFG
jgi:hypothetical protein